MPWLQLSFPLPKAKAEATETWLEGQGALAISLEDAADEPILELKPDEIRLWQQMRIIALFPIEQDEAALRHELAGYLDGQTLAALRLEVLEDQPWEQVWLKDFKPMRFGQQLWICPSGHTVSEPDAVVIDLDPGLAFGSGTHPSTALCLEWLAGQALVGKEIIDFGCGSGILAIAALKLGASKAHGLDHDPQAIIASRDNALRNGVLERLALYGPGDPLPPQAAIVVANILANTLIELEPLLNQLVSEPGDILLAGILDEQAGALCAVFNQHFAMEVVASQDGWALLHGVRNAC